jgi:hypothetical protein
MTDVYIIAIPNASQFEVALISEAIEQAFAGKDIEETEIVIMAGEPINKEELRELLFGEEKE